MVLFYSALLLEKTRLVRLGKKVFSNLKKHLSLLVGANVKCKRSFHVVWMVLKRFNNHKGSTKDVNTHKKDGLTDSGVLRFTC